MNEAVQIEASRLAQLQTQRETTAARILEIESSLASGDAQAREADPVAIALGEIAQPLDATDELHACRAKLSQLAKAIDAQNARLLAAQGEADRVANEDARPAHVAACRKLLAAAEALTAAIGAERAVRQSVVAGGHACHLDPLGEGLILPPGALADALHYVAIHSADPDGAPILCMALCDLPGYGARCGEPLSLDPRQFAVLKRDGAVDQVATPPAMPKRGQRVDSHVLE